jgi:hypothetical protein
VRVFVCRGGTQSGSVVSVTVTTVQYTENRHEKQCSTAQYNVICLLMYFNLSNM